MIFLANRGNLDTRSLLTRLHDILQTQVPQADAPVEQVRYHTSRGNKVGVRATITAPLFLGESHPVETAELHVSFDFPPEHSYDFYTIQWVEADRDLMIGWHQDDTHMDLGECHIQLDHHGETVQREPATFLDEHPLNVFDRRMDHLVEILTAMNWTDDQPHIPDRAIP